MFSVNLNYFNLFNKLNSIVNEILEDLFDCKIDDDKNL